MNDFMNQILQMTDPFEIEKGVEKLQVKQAFDLISNPSLSADKIAPIIAGLTLPVFKVLLLSETSFFKTHAQKEALHHRIVLLISENEAQLKKFQEFYEGLELRIEQFSVAPLVENSLESLHEELRTPLTEIHQSDKILNSLLELAWLAQRIDLIELLNLLKKRHHKIESYQQMLLEKLKQRLNSTFEAQDQSSALEALSSLGLSYESQWRGFLSILGEQNLEDLSENELLNLIEKRLERAGIHTVADFKTCEIYTQKKLLEYIK